MVAAANSLPAADDQDRHCSSLRCFEVVVEVSGHMSRGNVRVRPATLADIPQLIAFCEANKVGAGPSTGRQPRNPTSAVLADRLAGVLSKNMHTVLIAVDDDRDTVVGLLAATGDEVGAITPVPVLNVTNLVVDAKHRRRGIGRALLAGAVHLADERGVEQLVATVASNSRDGNRYLARLGFAPLVVRRIAPTSLLRRTLGLAETERLALRRLASVRRSRASLTTRVAGRGA